MTALEQRTARAAPDRPLSPLARKWLAWLATPNRVWVPYGAGEHACIRGLEARGFVRKRGRRSWAATSAGRAVGRELRLRHGVQDPDTPLEAHHG